MTSFIAAGGSGRSTSLIPAVPAASSVTTMAFMRASPPFVSLVVHGQTLSDDRLGRGPVPLNDEGLRDFCIVATPALSIRLPFTARSSASSTDARDLRKADPRAEARHHGGDDDGPHARLEEARLAPAARAVAR